MIQDLDIFDFFVRLGFNPKRLIEIGAAHPNTFRLKKFCENGNQIDLFEANPRLYYCLTKGFNHDDFQSTWPNIEKYPHENEGLAKYKNVRVHNVAIFNENKIINFYEFNASSFCEGVQSPAIINDNFNNLNKTVYPVQAKTIDSYDDGNVDIFLSDCEGAEWFGLEKLISRPILIGLETHSFGRYINPYIKEIEKWMTENNYKCFYKTESDSYYINCNKVNFKYE